MQRSSNIELFKEYMNFSAGHFTIFSSSDRENLHGHNYRVYACFTTLIDEDGLSFDYREYKQKLLKICQSLDCTTLLPQLSRYLEIEEKDGCVHVEFNGEKLKFLQRDVKLLPITNTTVEELSNWILMQLVQDDNELLKNKIQKIKVKVFSGPGQSGSAVWSKNNG